MRLEEIMNTNVKTISESASSEDARNAMAMDHIRHLVVTRYSKPVGIISERDVGGRRNVTASNSKTVGELMTPHVISAQVGTTLRQAANLLRGNVIGCLPVYRNKVLAGIVTVTDLLDAIGSGANRPARKAVRPNITRFHGRKAP